MKRFLPLLLVPWLLLCQTPRGAGIYSGLQNMASAPWIPPTVHVSGLPTASTHNGLTYLVDDSATDGDCLIGGGTIGSRGTLCWSNGTAWSSISSNNGSAFTGVVTYNSVSGTPGFVIPCGLNIQTVNINLIGNVASSTLNIACANPGQDITFHICLDMSGAWTFAFPPNVSGGAIDSTPGVCTDQIGRVNFNHTSVNMATNGATEDTPTKWIGPVRAPLSAPSTGFLNTWLDSVDYLFKTIDPSSNISVTMKALSARVAHQFCTFPDTHGSCNPQGIIASDLPSTYQVYSCQIENDTMASIPLIAANFPGDCILYNSGTIVEIDVEGGTGTLPTGRSNSGTGSINLEVIHLGTPTTILSASLPTSSGLGCAVVGTSQPCVFQGLTSSGTVTISNPSFAAGDIIRVSQATADGVQTWYNITINVSH